jgi:triphosphoribosyl-dephospho-CoA synthase
MGFPLSRDVIEASFLAACHAELAALKPGNVHIHRGGHGMDTEHFERAAAAAAPLLSDPTRGVGARILGAVGASVAATGLNTNLGIVLLCAPLATAAGLRDGPPDLRDRLNRVLDTLDLADTDQTFQAIVIANPAGLGRVAQGDVSGPPSLTLKDAMALAADRDRIARAYVSSFDDLFSHGLPYLYAARRSAENESMAVTALHMNYLASFADSHIARKYGLEIAEAVQREAQGCRDLWHPAPRHDTWQELLALDSSLKARGLNPGTTADFVVATLFADLLIRQSATNSSSGPPVSPLSKPQS